MKRSERIIAFLKRKNIEISFQRYALDAVGAMALGLFASLLTGTIIKTLGEQLTTAFGPTAPYRLLIEAGTFAMAAAGPAMAISIGYALRAPRTVLFSLCAVGIAANTLGGAGGPLAVLIVTLFATEAGKIVAGETRIDILVTPTVTVLTGALLSLWWAPGIGAAANGFGRAVMWATTQQPFLMGIIVSVLMGVALTLPISSAAICAALGLTGLAGGAAVAGCCAQMVGFAVLSFRENRWSGIVSQGIGTSMLQMKNILRNPRIWIPPTLVSAITGPIATCVFRLEMNGAPISSGMGTCGFVGPIGVITGWFAPVEQAVAAGATILRPTGTDWFGLFCICILLPAILTPLIGQIFRKRGWIGPDDLTLNAL
ncbi:MAG: PTS sugar transporter subunit IIC [Eubacteriales bacterium]|nr:PTS sugar transporter subunit IIC [Eubacteriales bacterium]